MTAYPAWTPASRPGIIPLHPLTFGRILGTSFAALRQNPRVLLGFALVVQTLVYILVLLGVGGIAFASFVRLDTLRPGTEDYAAVLAGSVLVTVLAGFLLGLVATAFTVIVQAVVVSEVAHAVVAERLSLRILWQRVRPVAWRLIGYAFALALAVVVLFAVVGAVIFGLALVLAPLAILIAVLAVLATLPLFLWLNTKLALVPSVIILERATIRTAIVRSWLLIRGRFWPALGILVVVAVIMSVLVQAVSVPFSLLSAALTGIIAPTGDPSPGAIVGVLVAGGLTQIVTLLIQAVALVVQATATALIYIDCRMRHEGLDLDLLAYVERRDSGASSLPDPYAAHAGRALSRPGVAPGFPVPTPPAPGYFAAASSGLPAAGPPVHFGAVGGAPGGSAAVPPPLPAAPSPPPDEDLPPRPAAPPPPPAPTAWTAPGERPRDPDRP